MAERTPPATQAVEAAYVMNLMEIEANWRAQEVSNIGHYQTACYTAGQPPTPPAQ